MSAENPPPTNSLEPEASGTLEQSLDEQVRLVEDEIKAQIEELLELKRGLPPEVTREGLMAIKAYEESFEKIHLSLYTLREVYEDFLLIRKNLYVIAAEWRRFADKKKHDEQG